MLSSRTRNWLIALCVLLGIVMPAMAAPTPEPSPSPKPTPQISPFPTPPDAAGPVHLTVESALLTALANSPLLLASLDSVRLAKYQVRAQYVPYNPTFTLSATYTRTLANIPVLFPGLNPNSYTFQGTVQQLLFDFGRVHWSGLAARLSEKQSKQNYRTQVETLLQQVETAYLNALLAQATVEVAREQVDLSQSELTLADNLYKGGFVAEFDVLQYKTQLGQAQQQLVTSEGSAEKARQTLVIVLGMEPGTQIVLANPADPPPPPQDARAGLAQALLRRPEVVALEWAVRAAEAQVHASGLASAPTVYVDAQYNGTPGGNGTFTFSQVTTFVSLNIPVLDGRLSYYQKKQSEAVLAQTQHSLQAQRRSVESDVVQAYVDMTTYWLASDVARRTVKQANEALKIATLRYREGFSSSIELLNQQNAYIQASLQLNVAIYNYNVALVNWRRAISGEYPVQLPDALRVDWDVPVQARDIAPVPYVKTPLVPTPTPTPPLRYPRPAPVPNPSASPDPAGGVPSPGQGSSR